jgi:cytochrome b
MPTFWRSKRPPNRPNLGKKGWTPMTVSPPPRKLRVWDLPTRLFHWLLVLLVALNIYTGNVGGLDEMRLHMLSGYAILALIVFRVVWGIVGSWQSRFASFVVGPGRVFAYARDLIRGRHIPTFGHNPLGALSVIAVLIVLAVQAITGLFANDDIFTEGPLADVAGKALSDTLTGIHHRGATILYVLIGLHLAAVFGYLLLQRENLIRPMIFGTKDNDVFPGVADAPFVSPWRAAIIATAAGLAVWGVIQI